MFDRYRNSNLSYYARNYARQLIPGWLYRSRLEAFLRRIDRYRPEDWRDRLAYCNKLTFPSSLGLQAEAIGGMRIPKKGKVYHFDLTEYTRWFEPSLMHHHAFGDVTHIPDHPSVVKSRPITGDNRNSVLMKLVKMRHFNFIHDPVPLSEKRNHLIGMASVSQPHRVRFFERYFNHPLCTLGQINRGTTHDQWIRPKMSIRQHLDYKFILCLEGYDVASNLKWVMSSGSLAVMPEPVYETWYMEGRLIPDVHYIRISSDYSDLEERLQHYIDHPAECLDITREAQAYTQRFRNNELEDLLNLLVLMKYFIQTGQMDADARLLDLIGTQ